MPAVSFPTIEFAAFFVVVFILSWALMPHPRAWRPFILVASYFFYGWLDWRWVLLLVGSTLVNTVAAQVIARSPSQQTRKRALIAAISFDLGLLCVFKYLGFFVSEVDGALDSIGLGSPMPLLQIVLPIGISFFTFQAISYVVDVYRGETKAASLGDVAILQAFFPHLVAGPIVRANELLPQLRVPRDPRAVLAGPALFLIVGGLIKKTVVADELARNVVDPVFNDPSSHSGPETLLAIYGFAAQIYCDFSGYTDMAIGLALLLGFQLPQNFNRPYLALSLQDFWRRWHMTLSRWLRDYLYIPLGGNRGGPRKTIRNLMLTMLLGGLWHGAAWTFVIWGGIHGGAMSVERWTRERFNGFHIPAWLAWLITFHVVCLAWIFFRSPDLSTAFDMIGQVFAGGPSPLVTLPMVFLVVATIGLQVLPGDFWERAEAWLVTRPVAVQGVAIGLVMVAADAAVGQEGVAPFIYFQF
ncbi:MAG: alginate O-acetyltransferase complex protein AlgI [Thermoleophilaceae bacterium]|jgi:D-alanyl-lipoteichoic acid acyltransferase DltB (MBOAT superfamily)|nr:alginate O-acetyltransferase complex protein AlgI [Thermoleophilaceae bacterium]